MTNYINTATLEYPRTELQVKEAFPSVSFPGEGFVPPEPFAVVQDTPKPAYSPITHTLAEGAPEFVDGQWVQTWVLTARDAADFQERLQADIIDRTQQRLDAFAHTRNYDDVNSISKYQNITDAEVDDLPPEDRPLVLQFRKECRYLAVKTAQTWAKLYQTLDRVNAGNWPTPGAGQAPTRYEDIEPELPPLEWPL